MDEIDKDAQVVVSQLTEITLLIFLKNVKVN